MLARQNYFDRENFAQTETRTHVKKKKKGTFSRNIKGEVLKSHLMSKCTRAWFGLSFMVCLVNLHFDLPVCFTREDRHHSFTRGVIFLGGSEDNDDTNYFISLNVSDSIFNKNLIPGPSGENYFSLMMHARLLQTSVRKI